jgi:hypothetical protein
MSATMTPDDFLAMAQELRILQQCMLDDLETGREIANWEFHDRFRILSGQFQECMRRSGMARTL